MATTIDTARLWLVPMTLACVTTADDRDAIARTTCAHVPEEWPVEHYDQDVLDATKLALAHDAGCEFITRYIVVREPEPTVAGIIGAAPPDADGRMMIGYSVLPRFQRRGFASEALRALVAWATSDARVRFVAGDTYPHLIGSIRTMESCGFTFAGPGEGEGVIRYQRLSECGGLPPL